MFGGVLKKGVFFRRPATSLKKRLWHSCFPVKFLKFSRTPFSIEHLWWLLLKLYKTQKSCMRGLVISALKLYYTAQKMKFSIKVFLSKCDQICNKLRIWSNFLEKFFTENFLYSSSNDTVILLIPCLILNPFPTNVPLLCPLKTSENRRFSDVFRGHRSGALVENRLKIVLNNF